MQPVHGVPHRRTLCRARGSPPPPVQVIPLWLLVLDLSLLFTSSLLLSPQRRAAATPARSAQPTFLMSHKAPRQRIPWPNDNSACTRRWPRRVHCKSQHARSQPETGSFGVHWVHGTLGHVVFAKRSHGYRLARCMLGVVVAHVHARYAGTCRVVIQNCQSAGPARWWGRGRGAVLG